MIRKPEQLNLLAEVIAGGGRFLKASTLAFSYRNWRGVIADRRVIPLSVRIGSTEYHAEAQPLLRAYDMEKGEVREFAMRDMHAHALAAPRRPEASRGVRDMLLAQVEHNGDQLIIIKPQHLAAVIADAGLQALADTVPMDGKLRQVDAFALEALVQLAERHTPAV